MNNELTLISVFSGAMGLDLGLEKAGFKTKVAIDLDKVACETIRFNKPDLPVIEGDLNGINYKEILNTAGLKKGEVTLLAGGSPCQSFSSAGKRRAFDDVRGGLLLRFIELVGEIEPEYFILENVRGILNAPIKNRPVAERGTDFSPLTDEEQKGSVLQYILKKFNETGYTVNYGLLNSANYGVPQARQRVFFIGSRHGNKIELPHPTHTSEDWSTFNDVLEQVKDLECTFKPYSEDRLKLMQMIPKGGGNWRDLPDNIAKVAMGGAYYSGGGKVGFFRRIDLNRPTPTLLTSPLHKSTIIGHPLEDRPLSIQEYKAAQQFPNDWEIMGNISDQYKLIGNAVPVGLAYAIGKSLIEDINKQNTHL